jgi:hypothetical protein
MVDRSGHETGRLTAPAPVLAAERAYRQGRRSAAGVAVEEPVVGLALSGGGIRSATFSLGVLQEAARRGALKFVDTLSTVSGGGYIGACLSSLLSRGGCDGLAPDGRDRAPYLWRARALGDGKVEPAVPAFALDAADPAGREMPLLEPGQIHHLRTHGEFLVVRQGLFNRELLRLVGTTVAGLLATAALFGGALLAAAGLFLGGAGLLGGTEVWQTITGREWQGWSGALARFGPRGGEGALGPLAFRAALGLLVAALAAAWALARPPRPKPPRTAETGQDRAEVAFLWSFLAVLAAPMVVLLVLHAVATGFDGGTVRPGPPTLLRIALPRQVGLPSLALPAYYFGGALLAMLILHPLLAWAGPRWSHGLRSRFGAMQGICLVSFLFSIALCATAAALWWLGTSGWSDRLGGAATSGGLGGALLVLARWSAPAGAAGKQGPGWLGTARAAARRVAVRVLIPAALALIFLAVAHAVAQARDPEELAPFLGLVITLGAAAVVVTGWLVDFNRISPHFFYRDRLAEAYLRTERKVSRGFVLQRDDGDLRLRDLHGRDAGAPGGAEVRDLVHRLLDLETALASARRELRAAPPDRRQAARGREDEIENEMERLRARIQDAHLRAAALAGNPAPYHLVVCALNLPGSRDLARKDRKSDHFIFSRLYCGSTTTGYVPTAVYRDGRTTLAQAMTVSGAATASSMGTYTSLSQAIVMTMFNLRLGYWMVNPRMYRFEGAYPAGMVPAGEDRPLYRRAVDVQERGIFWPKWLLLEMLALPSAGGKLVNLSDGGHTGDNVGIYPLLQRRCDLIVACDAGRDPRGSCADLAAAVRQIFVDENVEVEIDLEALRPDPATGLSRSHRAVGRIHYPAVAAAERGREGPPPEAAAKTGWLVYLKASRRGDEPVAVRSYHDHHPEFPHQSTLDQLFDDAQFEAYRSLGVAVARDFLASAGGTPSAWRDWCEREWAAGRPPSGDGRGGGAGSA